jgi:hypothetical protein
MPLFDRVISVAIGEPGTTGTLLEGLDIGFQIEKSAEGAPNVGQCEIFNLTETTRSKFKAGRDVMIINAGYRESDDGVRLCCALDVFDVRVEYRPPDVVTVVGGGDGIHTLRNQKLSISYKGPTSVKDIITDVIKQIGATLKDVNMTDVIDQTFQNGFAESGGVPDVLDRLCGRLEASWSFQDGEILVAPRNAPASSDVVVLNQKTGLIGLPEKRNKVQSVYVPFVRPGWIVNSLLNPRIQPNGRVRLQFGDVDAIYRVLTVKHTGHTRQQEFNTVADIAEW